MNIYSIVNRLCWIFANHLIIKRALHPKSLPSLCVFLPGLAGYLDFSRLVCSFVHTLANESDPIHRELLNSSTVVVGNMGFCGNIPCFRSVCVAYGKISETILLGTSLKWAYQSTMLIHTVTLRMLFPLYGATSSSLILITDRWKNCISELSTHFWKLTCVQL